MTIQQTTPRILAAAEIQDLAALEAARELRAIAIASLAEASPNAELCEQLAASIEAGEKAKLALKVIKRRLRHESRRLTQIETGFLGALAPLLTHQIDCKG